MAGVRIMVQFKADSVQEADQLVQTLAERSQAVQKEPGCLQFEVFRSVVHPEQYALIELWESQQVLDDRARAQGGPPAPRPGVTRTIERYEHRPG